MDINELFRPRLEEDNVELPGVGAVRVRALSRLELIGLEKVKGQGTLASERYMVALAMIDPALTEADVKRWQEVSPAGELNPVVARINQLSGIARGTDREVAKSVPDGPDAGL